MISSAVILGTIAVLVDCASIYVYTTSILRGETKPHLYTFLTWSIVGIIIFAGQVIDGAGPGAWVSGTIALSNILYLILSFKYGTKDIRRIDTFFLIGALSATAVWFVTEDVFYSVMLAVLIDILAIFPTLRKTYRDPYSESVLSWSLAASKYAFSVPATGNWSLVTLAFPVQAVIFDSILIAIALYRRTIVRRGTRRTRS